MPIVLDHNGDGVKSLGIMRGSRIYPIGATSFTVASRVRAINSPTVQMLVAKLDSDSIDDIGRVAYSQQHRQWYFEFDTSTGTCPPRYTTRQPNSFNPATRYCQLVFDEI